MKKLQKIAEKLMSFNDAATLTKAQWEIILNGCGAPKNGIFWKTLKTMFMFQIRDGRTHIYALHGLTLEGFIEVWNLYCKENRRQEKYYRNIAKRKKEIQKWREERKDKKYKILPDGSVALYNISEYDRK